MGMVEKVARAIAATGLVEEQKAAEVARAALAAMAGFPTTEMIEAGKDALTELAEPTDDEMRFVWLEMINAALAEVGEGQVGRPAGTSPQ